MRRPLQGYSSDLKCSKFGGFFEGGRSAATEDSWRSRREFLRFSIITADVVFFVYSSASMSAGFPPMADDASAQRNDPMATACFGLADFASKYAIAHPCTVLRRQCQVHQYARSLHLTPFTLVPTVCHLVSNDGLLTLGKGFIGSCAAQGLTYLTEIVISDVFGLPNQIVHGGSTEKFWRHVGLKAATHFVMMPFHISSFVETVRSEAGGIDQARVLDVLHRGLDRLRLDFLGPPDNSRRFSILHLAIPGVTYYTSHFLISHWIQNYLTSVTKRYVSRKPPNERTTFHAYLPQMIGQMGSVLMADILLYPFSTILHRMYIQGTRTLIDNLDTGTSAISITVKYTGFFDCLRTVVNKEGFWALYGGFGALALQCGLNFMLLRLVRSVFDHGRDALQISTVPVMPSSGHSSAPSSHFNNPNTSSTGFLPSPTHPGASFSRYVPPPQHSGPDYYHVGPSSYSNPTANNSFPGSSSPPLYDAGIAAGDMLLQSTERPPPLLMDDAAWNKAQAKFDHSHGF